MASNGSNPTYQPAPAPTKGTGFDTTVKIVPVVLGVLCALVTGLLFIVDKPSEAKVRVMIEDRADRNTFRIERLEKQVDELESRVNRMIEERTRERAEIAR